MAAFRQIDNPEDIRQAYQFMVQTYGKEIFSEPRRALGCLVDMAPKLTGEAQILKTALQCEIPAMLQSGGTGTAEQTEQAKKAVKCLETEGMDPESAMSVVENLCAVLGIIAEVRPDYAKGGQIPYEPESGTDIKEAIAKLNHIRWFLNHQEEYKWLKNKDRLTGLRSLMNYPSKNQKKILEDYKNLVHEFCNDPYEKGIVLSEAGKTYSFTADSFDKYFVNIDNMPVAVGFARKYPASERAGAMLLFDAKKKLTLSKISVIKSKVQGNSTSGDATAARTLVSAGKRFALFSLIFMGIFGYLAVNAFNGVDFAPFAEYIAQNISKPQNILSLFQNVSQVRTYMAAGTIGFVAAVVMVLLLFRVITSLFRCMKIRRNLLGPQKKQKKMTELLEKEIPAKVDALERLLKDYWNSSADKAEIRVQDYRKELSLASEAPSGQKIKAPVTKAGKRLRFLIVLLCILLVYEKENGLTRELINGSSVMTAYVSSEAFSTGTSPITAIGDMIWGNQDGLYEDSSANLEQAVSVGIADATQSSYLNTGSGVYTVMSAIDGNTDTSWQEGVDGDGIGEYILLAFDQSCSVEYISLKLGNWRDAEHFAANNRPQRLTFELGGETYTYDFPDEQREFILHFKNPVLAENLRITVDGVYNGDKWNDTCISEVAVYAAGESNEAKMDEAADVMTQTDEIEILEAEEETSQSVSDDQWNGLVSRNDQQSGILVGSALDQQTMVGYLMSNTASRAAYVLDINKKMEYGIENSDTPMPASALISIPILFTIADGIEEGSLQASSMVTYSRTFQGGRGNTKKQDGMPYTLIDLVGDMLSYSDNNAMNSLIDYLGLDRINDTCHEYGFDSVDMQRKLMNETSSLENYISPKDAAMMLNAMYQNNFDRIDRSFLENYFYIDSSDSSNTGMYSVGCDYPVFLNANGVTESRYNEIGLFEDDERVFIVAIMTADGKSENSMEMVRNLTQYIADTL